MITKIRCLLLRVSKLFTEFLTKAAKRFCKQHKINNIKYLQLLRRVHFVNLNRYNFGVLLQYDNLLSSYLHFRKEKTEKNYVCEKDN